MTPVINVCPKEVIGQVRYLDSKKKHAAPIIIRFTGTMARRMHFA
jgi:hypothetical protein